MNAPCSPRSTDHALSPRADTARAALCAAVEEAGVVAIVRLTSAVGLVEAAHATARGGVRALEVTLSVPGALDGIRALAEQGPDDLLLGAGSLLEPEQVAEVVAAGARYVVSPICRGELIDAAHSAGVPIAVGCMTPTEMDAAWRAGADWVKLFPATALGPRYLKDVLAPMPHLRVLPTGGIDAANAGAWIEAGAVAVGAGTSLIAQPLLQAGDFSEITRRARALAAAVSAARVGRS